MGNTKEKVEDLIKKIAAEYELTDPKVVCTQLYSGNNFTTDIFNAKITAKEVELKLFAKIGTVSDELRASMDYDYIYRTERYFYNELAKAYNGLLDQHKVPDNYRVKFPKHYASRHKYGEEIIVLEDLVDAGYGPFPDRFKSLNWEQASRCVEMLANFHAMSFAYEREAKLSFESTVEKLQFFTMVKSAEVQKATDVTIKNALPLLREEDRQRVRSALEDFGEKFYKYSLPLVTPVLVHGDYRPCNIMQKVENGVTMPVLVDFQTVHLGCAANDLVYFVFMATDQQFRRDHLDGLVDHYYTHLGQTLKRLGMLIKDVYPRETFDFEFKSMLPVGLLASVLVLPVICLGPEDLGPTLDTMVDGEVTPVKLNDRYKERFLGNVEDCIRMGAI